MSHPLIAALSLSLGIRTRVSNWPRIRIGKAALVLTLTIVGILPSVFADEVETAPAHSDFLFTDRVGNPVRMPADKVPLSLLLPGVAEILGMKFSGGSGAGFTSANCPASKRKCASRSTGDPGHGLL
jgi:hypothetical protein